MANYENLLLDSMEMVVQNALSNAKYDRTIQATVLKCNDSLQGIYTVKYQDAKFTAYASNVNDVYTENMQVYILVPENNMSSHKTILGTVKNLGTNYSSVILDSQRFFEIGSNIINLNKELSICSYKCLENAPEIYKNATIITGTKINEETGDIDYIYEQCHGVTIYDINSNNISYKKDSNENLLYIEVKEDNETFLTIDIAQLKLVFQKNIINTLKMGGVFRTSLPEEQQSIPGDYGLYIEVNGTYNKTQSQKRFLTIGTRSMVGNPYQLFSETEQVNYKKIDDYVVESIDKIVFFGKDFPEKEDLAGIDNKPDDIFLSQIFCHPCYQISDQELTSFNLQVRTPQGIYFNADEAPAATKILDAIVQKGATNITDSDQISFYWFEENAKINFKTGYKSGYDPIGGDGWKCLNTLDTTEQSHISDVSTFKVKKKDLPFEEKKYLCAAIYNDLKLTKEITMYNYGAQYKIVLSSSRGNNFSTIDTGTTQINVVVYERQNEVWSILDKTLYIADWYTQDEYGNYQNQATGVEYIQIDLSNFSINYTIKCAVTLRDSNGSTGSQTLELQKSSGTSGKYSLVINNKNKIFLYDEQGISPTHKQLSEHPIVIMPIDYYIYNNETGEKILGENIPKDFAKWEFPSSEESLIIKEETTEYNSQVTFDIADKYDATKNNNNSITLTVTYDGEILIGITDILFAKQGDNGTNGTRFALKIVPNEEVFGEHTYFPLIPLNTNSTIFAPDVQSNWFKAALYYDGVLIFENSISGKPNKNIDILTDSSNVNLVWEFIKSSNKDECSFEVDSDTGLFCTKLVEEGFPVENLVNIIQAEATYNGKTVIASLPIATILGQNAENFSIVAGTGFKYVTYKADKTTPSYAQSAPFFQILPINSFNWETIGESYYGGEWHKNKQLSIVKNDTEEGTVLELKPAKEYDGYSLSNAVVGKNNDVIIHIPIHFLLNRYANASINGWDGNKIILDDDNGAILAPQIIAGIKEKDNTFTGAFMGTARHMSEDDDIGFMAYNHGRRSFFLDAYTGTATFGIEDIGSIKIEPGKEPIIQSGHYEEKNIHSSIVGQGISIGFGAEPYIKFGTEKFYVESDGTMYAEGATINGEFEVYDEDSENQSYIFLNERKSEIRLFDYDEAAIGRYVRGETYISPKEFLLAGYNAEDYIEPIPESYKDYKLPEPYNFLRYKKGELSLKGEFECETDSSEISFKNSANATHIKFWNTKIENRGTEQETGYIKNTSEWTPAHLFLYNYGNGDDGYEKYELDDEEPPTPKGYFKYGASGLAIKGTFSSQTKSSKIRFSDKPMQNYIKFADVEDVNGGQIIKCESEWTPRRFSLKTYGATGKYSSTVFSSSDEYLSQLYDKFLNGEITEAEYDSAERSYMAKREKDEDSDDVISSLTYANGVLRYKGGLTLAAPPYAKINIDPQDGKNSVIQFKDYIEYENGQFGEEISSTIIKPGEISIRTKEIDSTGTTSEDVSELTMKKGKLRLKGELDMETPVVKIRFAKGGPESSYICFNNQISVTNPETGEEYSQLLGKQRMSAEMFRLATYDEDGKIDSSFKFQDGSMKYRGNMEIKTDSGIFSMTEDKMLIRMGETDEEGRKITDFRLTPRGFSFRAFGPAEEEEASLPHTLTKTITYYKKDDPNVERSDKEYMNNCYQHIEIYGADFIPEDGITDETAEYVDSLFTIRTNAEEQKENQIDLGVYNEATGSYQLKNEVDRYNEYTYKITEDGEEEKITTNITETYKEVVPSFMNSTTSESWVEKSALMYDSEYGKLRLNGNLSVRNDHGTVILTDKMMRITFKSFAQDDTGKKVPKTRMSISEDSFYFYTFGNTVQETWIKTIGDDGLSEYALSETRATGEYGLISGLYYSPDSGLNVIGRIEARSGKIAGWEITPFGFQNVGQNISINAGGSVAATGNGKLVSKGGQRRSSLKKGRIMIEGIGYNAEMQQRFSGILTSLDEKQRELLGILEAEGISTIDGKQISKIPLNNRTKRTAKGLFYFPDSPEEFYNDHNKSNLKDSVVNSHSLIIEWYTNDYNKWRESKWEDFEKILTKNSNSDEDDYDSEYNIGGENNRKGWCNFGSIYGGNDRNEGVNIVAEGRQSGEYMVQDNFEEKQIQLLKSSGDGASSGSFSETHSPRGIYFGLLSNIESYDMAIENNAIDEGSSNSESDSGSGASSTKTPILYGGQVSGFNSYCWTDKALNFLTKSKEIEEIEENGITYINPFHYYRMANNIEGYKIATPKKVGKLSMIMGYLTPTSASSDVEKDAEKRYLYGTEIFPHMIKTDDIFIHNKSLIEGGLYHSSSLDGILRELHSAPKSIEWIEEDKNKPQIKETWDFEKYYYDKDYQKKKKIVSEERIWELELDEQEGDNIDLNDREVKSITLKIKNSENQWEEKMTIDLSGFIVDL